MSLWLLLWLQSWTFPTPARQIAQDLRVLSGLHQDAWVGYRAYRAGQTHLFLHHIDTSGYETFGRAGLCLSCGDTTSVQSWQAVVGEKNWLYSTWSTRQQTYIHTLDAEGNTLWRFHLPEATAALSLLPHPEGGVALLRSTAQALRLHFWNGEGKEILQAEIAPSSQPKRKGHLIPSGIEGFWVIWETFGGEKWELWMQKWRWNGQPDSEPRRLSGISRSVENAEFIGDGFGGLLGVYESTSLTGAGKDLYLLRYNRNGTRLYEAPVCTEIGDQQSPHLYKRGTDLLIVWEDNRNQDWDLFHQRIDIGSGKALLDPAGIPLVKLPGPQRSPHLVLDYFQNELIAVWIDQRRLQGDIYLQRYDARGKALWEFAGRPLADNPHQQHTLQVATQDFQYFWVAYLEDYPQEGTYPHLALLTTQGQVRFHRALVGNRQRAYARIQDLHAFPWGGRLLMIWGDDRDTSGRRQLYGQLLGPDLTPLWFPQGRPIAPQPHLSQLTPHLCLHKDTLWILWQGEESDVESDLFAQALTPNEGKKLFPRHPFPVCVADRVQHEARWITQGQALYATWTDTRSMEETGFDLYLRRIWPPAPEAGWRAQRTFQNSAFVFFRPDTTLAHHLWQEEIQGKYQMLYSLAPLGEITTQPTLLSPTLKAQRFLQAVATRSGHLYAAFCEEAPGPYEQTLRLFAISPTGTVVWQHSSPFPYNHHLYPALTLLRNGDLLLTALAATAPNRWDLVYARFSPTGQLQEKGTLLTPVPERSRWQIVEQENTFWLLLQLPTGYTLHQGSRLSTLKPVRLPAPLGEGLLLSWQDKIWLYWSDAERRSLHLTPLTPTP